MYNLSLCSVILQIKNGIKSGFIEVYLHSLNTVNLILYNFNSDLSFDDYHALESEQYILLKLNHAYG